MSAAARLFGAVTAIALFLGATLLPGPAWAQRTPKGAPVPFEVELSKSRRDRTYLSFNEHISNVPATRIRDLPTVNGRMGDRVTVPDGHTLHFPLGYLVTASYVFDKQRTRTGTTNATIAAELEANPAYAMVQRFDAELGPVCARTEDKARDVKAEFRLRPNQTMAVVLDMPGRFDAITREKTRSYLVFVGTEERYVVLAPAVRRLLVHCRSGARETTLPPDGSALDVGAVTGVN